MKIADDLFFCPGVAYVVIVDTDSYSGNFERELKVTIAAPVCEII